MRLIYTSAEYIRNDLPGVEKKIQDQLLALKESGVVIERTDVKKKPHLMRAIPFSSTLSWNRLAIPNADCQYIRMEPFSFPFICYLRKCRRQAPRTHILVELPTYPYDTEIKRLNIITQIRDRFYRRYLYKYVNRIVTFTDDREIFGIKTIGIQNGIDVQSVPVAKGRTPDGEIHLIAVAALQKYHGYERILEGLHLYYSGGGERTVRFLIVGSGYAEDELQKMTKEYKIENYVEFLGPRKGSALTEAYNLADIGVGSFGLYKRKDSVSSALKTREYLARGLPVISGCIEDVFRNKEVDFYLEFDNNERPVDIQQVVTFYDRLFSEGKESLSGRVREFALRNVDVRSTFKPVVDYIMGTGERL